MLKLYLYPTSWDISNASPFCMKIENYLRLVQIPFERVIVSDPRKSPKGKLPYIDDGGQVVPDSSFIIEYLKNKYGDPLDGHLTAIQKATALAIRHMLEEHLYWVIVYSRWVDPKGWEVVKPVFFAEMPPLLRAVVPELIRRQLTKVLHSQGIGRHHSSDIYKLGCEDLTAVSIILGEQRFILGNDPTSLDAVMYAFLANILLVPVESPLKEHAKSLSNLSEYCVRMKERVDTAAK